MKYAALLLILLSVTFTPSLRSQRVSGTVRDAGTGEPMQFANVWVEKSNRGTTTDRLGRFTLELGSGTHTLVTSYIGYDSDRRTVTLPAPDSLHISLRQSAIRFPEVTVTPGDNPALRIIRNAIDAKEKRRERMQNYQLTSHSKIVVDLTGIPGLSGDGSSVSVSGEVGAADSAKPEVTAVLETQTQATWAKPNRYKEVVVARKQTSFIPSEANILISAFFIVDFSADVFRFSDRTVDGPISGAGLDSYYYSLTGTTTIDGTKIYMIDIAPLNDSAPLLSGTLYIADETWALSMVDVRLNDAAMPTFFDTLAFKQHFRLFDGEFWMPVDVVIDAGITIPIVNATVNIEGFSVLQDYVINSADNENVFDRTMIKVMKEADERDSTYWAQHQKIPNTMKELEAYRSADSIKTVLDSTRNSYGFMDALTGKRFSWDDAGFSVPGLLDIYRFNRVEGNALYVRSTATQVTDWLTAASASAGYGFDDERFKYDLGLNLRILEAPDLRLRGSLYDEMRSVTAGHDQYGTFMTTLTSLTGKSDYKDYFYRRGWNLRANYDLLMLLPVSLGIEQSHDDDAYRNTNWSLFRQPFDWRQNPGINTGRTTTVTASVTIDDRQFIDNAGKISRFGSKDNRPTLSARWSEADMAGERFAFASYMLTMRGTFEIGRAGGLSYDLEGGIGTGTFPTQALPLLYGTMPWLTGDRRFRTLDYREFGGDRYAMLFVTHDFRDAFFRWTHIPLLKDSGWGVRVFGAMGWSAISDGTRSLQVVPVEDVKAPFYEAGFGVDISGFLQVDLGWRLNHFRDGRNFYLGFSSSILR